MDGKKKLGDMKFNRVCIQSSRNKQASEITMTPAYYRRTIIIDSNDLIANIAEKVVI